jgi:CRP-like cAMP-binding protein
VKCRCKFLPNKQGVGLPDDLKPRFFSGLTTTELSSVLSVATHQSFPKATVIVNQDEPAERFFLLASGQGRRFVTSVSGHKIMLDWLTCGQFTGDSTISAIPTRYLASTEVLPMSCALVWERKTIRELVTGVPILLENAIAIWLTENIAGAIAARVSLSTDDAAGRVAQLLSSLASGIGKPRPDGVVIRVGNEELAAGANVTPFTVSRTLRDWQREGILRKGRGTILLQKPELLFSRDEIWNVFGS